MQTYSHNCYNNTIAEVNFQDKTTRFENNKYTNYCENLIYNTQNVVEY